MSSVPDSPVVPSAPGWAKPLPRDERLFMYAVLGSVVLMSAFVLAWIFLSGHNVPTKTFRTSPAAFSQQVTVMVDKYGAPDGQVYLPPGQDGYILASRYSWYPNLVLQVGQPYTIWLSSADALHGFSLVGCGQNLNLEVAPNHAFGATFTPDSTGRCLVVCNEFCGLGHARMQAYLTVVSAQQMAAHRTGAATAKPGTKGKTAAPASGASTLALQADKTALKFSVAELKAPAGKVTISMKNPSAIPHNIAIKGNGIDSKGAIVLQGGTSVVTADLEPGTYTFYCSVPGHEAAGMKGILTITAREANR